MYPSTVQSTLGGSPVVRPVPDDRARAQPRGFRGVGRCRAGTDDAELIHLEGDDAQPMVHTMEDWPASSSRPRYGWNHCRTGNARYASFTEQHDASPPPHRCCQSGTVARILSADGPLMAALPTIGDRQGRGQCSWHLRRPLRRQVTDIITAAGGRVESDPRRDRAQSIKMSACRTTTHVVATKHYPGNMECMGDAGGSSTKCGGVRRRCGAPGSRARRMFRDG